MGRVGIHRELPHETVSVEIPPLGISPINPPGDGDLPENPLDGLCPRCWAEAGEPHDRYCPESIEEQAERAAEERAERERERGW